jgi:PmbA protein
MEAETLARRALEALQRAGAQQAQCHLTEANKSELNAEWDEPSLLRSTFEHRLELVAIVDGKKGVLSFNETSPHAIERAAREVVELANASRPDPANAIAEAQPQARFESGPEKPSLDGMHHRMEELLAYRQQHHPQTTMRALHFDFTRASSVLLNSNGVDLQATTGAYTFVATFSSRSGADTSSFNFSAACTRDLDKPVAELGSFERLMRQSGEQMHTERVVDLVPGGKFVGDLVVTPDCLGSFLSPISRYLGDEALISGTSIYQDRLGERVADPALTIHSRPRSDEMAAPSFFTRDGFVCEDATVIDQGVLRTFLLSHYGARKTGLSRAANEGDAWVVEPGQVELEELVRSVDQGVLLCRFSGGRPSASGDFSGIAKNSYLISKGKLGPPLSETMVSGNLVRLLEQLRGVSKERVHFGYAVFPWVAMSGATIS